MMPKAAKKNDQAAHTEPPAESKEPLKPYEPTKREKSALEAFDNRRRRQKPAPRIKVISTNDDATDIKLDHTDQAVGS